MNPAPRPWFDPAALERIERIGGEALRREIIEIFVGLAPERISKLREAERDRDRDALRAGLHSLVSTAGNVGGLELHRLALQGQASAPLAPWEELGPLVERTDRAMRRLVEQLAGGGA